MRKIIYHVATTLDGYIAHADNTTAGFSFAGPHVDAYMQQLQRYDTVIMGKNTYEAGYQFGLKAGEAVVVYSEKELSAGMRIKVVESLAGRQP